MESLAEILSRKQFKAPDEVTSLKAYIEKHFDVKPKITVRGKNLILSVPNSALAGTLQMKKPNIIKACNLKSQLIIRVGS
jgi:hypothetical protein